MNNTVRLRCDLTQAVANKMNEFETRYKHILFFGAMYEENADSLMYFQEVEFKPDKDDIVMKAKLEKEFFDTFTDDELNKVKEISLAIQQHDLIEQMSKVIEPDKNVEITPEKVDKKTAKQISNIIDNIVKRKCQFRNITNEEQKLLKKIQENFYEKLDLKMDIMTTDMGYGLQIITDALELNGKQLRVLVSLLHKGFDFLSIKAVSDKIMLTLGNSLDEV